MTRFDRDLSAIKSFTRLCRYSEQSQYPMRDVWRGLDDGSRLDYYYLPDGESCVAVRKGHCVEFVNSLDAFKLLAAAARMRAEFKASPFHKKLTFWMRER